MIKGAKSESEPIDILQEGVLGIVPRILHLLGKRSAAELMSQALFVSVSV